MHDPLCRDLPQDSTEHGMARNVAKNVAENVAVSATFRHDPLCPRYLYDMPCYCNLIGRVRDDERTKFAYVVGKKANELSALGHKDCELLADGARLGMNEYLSQAGRDASEQ
jgi:hypothetical protein